MLPIRVIAEATGADVNYDTSTKTIRIEGKYGESVECTVGQNYMYINGEATELDASPYIKESRTYLPVRAVSEGLNLDVDWEASTKSVDISAPY